MGGTESQQSQTDRGAGIEPHEIPRKSGGVRTNVSTRYGRTVAEGDRGVSTRRRGVERVEARAAGHGGRGSDIARDQVYGMGSGKLHEIGWEE